VSVLFEGLKLVVDAIGCMREHFQLLDVATLLFLCYDQHNMYDHVHRHAFPNYDKEKLFKMFTNVYIVPNSIKRQYAKTEDIFMIIFFIFLEFKRSLSTF